MCLAGLFTPPPKPFVPAPPPPTPVEPIKPPPPPEVLKKEPASIAPAPAPTSKKRKTGLGIEDQAGQTESPVSSGVPLGIGANSDNKIINTGV